MTTSPPSYSMKIPHYLFLIHIEEAFRKFFPRGYEDRVIRATQYKRYDQVFLMCSSINNTQPIDELMYLNRMPQILEWDWGYEPECFEGEEKKWVIPSYGHEWTWIHPIVRDLVGKKAKVDVGGGYEPECLQDFLSCLDHLDIPYNKVRELVY